MGIKIVIVGAGPAGVTVAETLRKYDKSSEITLLSHEPFPPYAPPAMIEYFMSGHDLHLQRWKDILQQPGIDYRQEAEMAEALPEQQAIRLTDNTVISYDRLVIATGSRLYAPIPGADKPGIYNFKSLKAATELIKSIRDGQARTALIVGAGFIGVEIALLLVHLGVSVILIEMSDIIMHGMLDNDTAEIACTLLQKKGINLRLKTKCLSFTGDSRAEGVELESGERIKADILIAATGVKPNIEFLKGSGIESHWGIVVDAALSTSIPHIYAAGDVTETVNRITGRRYVHAIFPNAVAQGQIVAYNLLGWNVSYEGAEKMNSLKHLGIPIIAAGEKTGEELSVQKGDTLKKLYCVEGCIVGFQLAGDVRGAGLYRTLMNKKVTIETIKHHLLDPGRCIGSIPSSMQTIYQTQHSMEGIQ